MKTTIQTLLLPLCALLLAGALLPARAQDTAGAPATQSRDLPTEDQLELRYFTPTQVSAQMLYDAAETMLRRKVTVRRPDGSLDSLANLFFFGDSVLIYELPERHDRLVEALRELEKAYSSGGAGEPAYEVLEYTPRYLSITDARDAVRPYFQESFIGGPSITPVEERRALVLRHLPAEMHAIQTFLTRIDVPAPQVLLTCHLVQPSSEAGSGGLPDELVENLTALVPSNGWTQIALGVLRTSANTQRIFLDLTESGSTRRWNLTLQPGAYDDRTGSLSLDALRFERHSPNGPQPVFDTSTVVRGGEFTVIGAAGETPVFVVLRITPIRL